MNDRHDNPAKPGNRGGVRFIREQGGRKVSKKERRKLTGHLRPRVCRHCRGFTPQITAEDGKRQCRLCGGRRFLTT